MANSRTSIAVLGMAGVKPHVQGKGLVLGLALEKFNPPVHDQVSLVTERAVRLFLVERIATVARAPGVWGRALRFTHIFRGSIRFAQNRTPLDE